MSPGDIPASDYLRGYREGVAAAIERLRNEALAIQWVDEHGNDVVALDALLVALDDYETNG